MADETTTFRTNVTVLGHLQCAGLTAPNESIGTENWNPGSPLTVQNQRHQHICRVKTSGLVAISSIREVIHSAFANGTIRQFQCGFAVDEVTWAGGGQMTVELWKNGVNILSAALTLNAATVVREQNIGTITGGEEDYTEEDLFEVVTTFTAGTGTPPKGFFADLIVDEEQD